MGREGAIPTLPTRRANCPIRRTSPRRPEQDARHGAARRVHVCSKGVGVQRRAGCDQQGERPPEDAVPGSHSEGDETVPKGARMGPLSQRRRPAAPGRKAQESGNEGYIGHRRATFSLALAAALTFALAYPELARSVQRCLLALHPLLLPCPHRLDALHLLHLWAACQMRGHLLLDQLHHVPRGSSRLQPRRRRSGGGRRSSVSRRSGTTRRARCHARAGTRQIQWGHVCRASLNPGPRSGSSRRGASRLSRVLELFAQPSPIVIDLWVRRA